jgi:hypothetical protein
LYKRISEYLFVLTTVSVGRVIAIRAIPPEVRTLRVVALTTLCIGRTSAKTIAVALLAGYLIGVVVTASTIPIIATIAIISIAVVTIAPIVTVARIRILPVRILSLRAGFAYGYNSTKHKECEKKSTDCLV